MNWVSDFRCQVSGVGQPVDVAHMPQTPDTRHLKPRSGVTLIELMIAIMIIGILAAAVLGVAAVAGETAREAKTKSMISRLHSLLMEQYDTYASRRVRLWPEVLRQINSSGGTTAEKGRIKAEVRLYALREMILMEVPDRWSDVLLEAVPPLSPSPITPRSPIYLAVPDTTRRTELANVYLRNYRRIATSTNKITGTTNSPQQILENQGAECLYMVVMNACGDGEARTLFPESSIGDTDGDGAQEFLDGWGHPIEFLRWAPGFESDIQVNANEFGNPPPADPTSVPAWVTAAAADHDPFDLYRTDFAAFRLVPLIYSAGRDEEFGLMSAQTDYATWIGVAATNATVNLASPLKLLPWRHVNTSGEFYAGTDNLSKTATDNINNHLISTR